MCYYIYILLLSGSQEGAVRSLPGIHIPNVRGFPGDFQAIRSQGYYPISNKLLHLVHERYIYIWSRVPCSHPPPWDGGGMMPLWWCIYIHTYLHTYLPTYLRTYIHTIALPYLTLPYITLPYITLPYIPYIHTYHYITLPYLTLPYLTLHSIHTYITLHYIHTYITLHYIHTYIHIQTHTYIHACMHACIHTYIHTNIPTYQHTTIPPPQATGGGTRRTIPPPQATGGGPEEPDDTVHPYPLVGGGEGGWPTLHHIYISIYGI